MNNMDSKKNDKILVDNSMNNKDGRKMTKSEENNCMNNKARSNIILQYLKCSNRKGIMQKKAEE